MKRTLIPLIVFLCLVATCVAAEVRYTVTDLGALPNTSKAHAYGINNKGQVIGTVYGYGYIAFLWENGVMTDLGTFDGLACHASDINDSGQIAGYTDRPDLPSTAILWDNLVRINLDTLDSPRSLAFAINNKKQVVGWADYPDGKHAFFWANDTMYDLNPILGGDWSTAEDINDSGFVVGTVETSGGSSRGYIWDGDTITILPTLGGSRSKPYGINDKGLVVGEASTYGLPQHAFLWDDGVMVDLMLGDYGSISRAYSINNLGQVVGFNESDAYLWEHGMQFRLNDLIPAGSGWYLSSAQDINDLGQIVGRGSNSISSERAFLLTPTTLTIDIYLNIESVDADICRLNWWPSANYYLEFSTSPDFAAPINQIEITNDMTTLFFSTIGLDEGFFRLKLR